MKNKLLIDYSEVISVENLLSAWTEFVRGKRNKQDVQEFSLNLMDNIIHISEELANKTYTHGGYFAFKVNDPKPRSIHKASVADRLIHHAIYRKLYPFFDKTFISDSFSCRLNKGTHKALERFKTFHLKASKNNTKTCFVLKCDIRKFFANINHQILIDILKSYIPDTDIIWLLENIIRSFSVTEGTGLPLGNLTSQLFVNIYMNQFDQFMKHRLKAKYYIRYSDDFVILSEDKAELEDMLLNIKDFLLKTLKLELHPNKVSIETVASGVDFLGWVHFPDHRVLRTATRNRMLRNPKLKNKNKATINSYLGLLQHGNTEKLKKGVLGL